MMQDPLVSDLERLVSEARNPRSLDIDRLPTAEILRLMNEEDREVPAAVGRTVPAMARAVDMIVAAFRRGGRLVYVGAGTSGRLGVLDASECPPTFSVPEGLVVGLIAGGATALTHAVEGAEDDEAQGARDLDAIAVSARDVVVGIAASGRTPYVVGALARARAVGAGTVTLSCNPDTAIADLADVAITPVVGPEVIAGSTRLKSGTAQKLVLNMLSTAAMIRMGKVYQNLMVDLTASNGKLQVRARMIVMEAAGIGEEEARRHLDASGNDVKLAILVALTGWPPHAAREALDRAGGVLRRAIAGGDAAGS